MNEFGTPTIGDLSLELPRASISWVRSVMLAPLLRSRRGGDGHPVVVLPGFLASDASTLLLRSFTSSLGHPTTGWQVGRNIGPTEQIVEALPATIAHLASTHGRTVTLIGWSLGGIMARRLARDMPQHVRQVITLGSPIRMSHPTQTRASWLYASYSSRHSPQHQLGDAFVPDLEPMPVPSTSIFTRNDGIVSWQACQQAPVNRAENIQVRGAHCGLGHHPAALLAIADRLGLEESAWRPFRPPALVRHWYPDFNANPTATVSVA